VAVLGPQVRIIAADIQWIMQERRGNRWRNKYYFHTKEGLLFYAPKPAAAALVVLPRWFPDPSHKPPPPTPPALGMPAATAVADACTGAVIADGIETVDRAEGWRDGFEVAQRIKPKRGRRQ
jgi:hypothetical protein